jgi:hypothetical protein
VGFLWPKSLDVGHAHPKIRFLRPFFREVNELLRNMTGQNLEDFSLQIRSFGGTYRAKDPFPLPSTGAAETQGH